MTGRTGLNTETVRRLAFVGDEFAPVQLTTHGSLAGLDFAAKDLIDVKDAVTGCGNPDKARDGMPALAHAPSVLVPLMNGARLMGKTQTDEVACGMFGMNPHYGIPINPNAPDRVPGGSSSGSASAVAAGLCDFALGTDTGGSVRVPASFCGIHGLRTSHGRLSPAGVMAMAPSFDTIGWLARDAATLRRVGACYFGPPAQHPAPRLLIATDAFALPEAGVGEALLSVVGKLGSAREVELYGDGLSVWLDTFRPLQLHELWATLGAWAMAPGRRLSPAVADRFALAASVDQAAVARATVMREHLTARLIDLLGDDGILILPTAHDLPPLRDAPVAAQVAFRDRTLALTCVASLCRLPQISMPAAMVEGCPVGLSAIAGPRGDERLLALGEMVSPVVRSMMKGA